MPVMSLVPWSQSLTSCKLSLPGQIASCAISIDLCTLCYKQWLQLIDISALLELVDLTVLAHVIRLAGLQKQSSGASAVQHTCAVLQDTCMCCLHACEIRRLQLQAEVPWKLLGQYLSKRLLSLHMSGQ